MDDLQPNKKRNKTGISTTFNKEELQREPVTLSLYPEYFEDEEDESVTAAQASQKFFQDMLDEMGGLTYDPELLGRKNYVYVDPEVWPESIRRKVEASVARYMHYLESDVIKPDEVPKFQKRWMVNALRLISEKLLRNEQLYRTVFHEIFENFKWAMKKSMLDYILLCP